MPAKVADLHSHYPMHVLSGDARPRLRTILRRGSGGGRLRRAVMWLANRIANYRSWDAGPRVTFETLRAGDAGLVLSVLYAPFSEIDLGRRYASPPDASYPADLLEQLHRVEADLSDNDPDGKHHVVVRDVADLDRAEASGRMAFVHCVEGGFHLGATPDEVRKTVATLAEHGVAYITLAHLFWRRVATNAPAIPFIPDGVYNVLFPQDTDEPLSDLGVAAIEAMYEHNVLIDVSHMREDAIDATFALVERLDAKTGADPRDHPIIASHVGVRLRENGQRYNLSRRTVQRIAERGGVVGLLMAQHQLNDGVRRRRTRTFDESFDVIVKHLDALYEWTGSHKHSGIGSDLDGFIKPTMGGIETAADLARLRDALAERYGAKHADRIVWGNAQRVVRGALAARSGGPVPPGEPPPPPPVPACREGSTPALALSGGGHRAAFFHIGVLARLAELRLLRGLRSISTVSGGSIVGVLYYLHVKALLEAVPDAEVRDADYTEAVRSVERLYRAAAARDLRGRALLDYGRDLRLASPRFSRTNRIAELYDAWFYRPIRYDARRGGFVQEPTGQLVLEDLLVQPKDAVDPTFDAQSTENDNRSACVPILIVNATTLNTGHSFSFQAVGMGELPLKTAAERDVDRNVRLAFTRFREIPSERRTHTLGTAVAASAAFPGGYAPLTLPDLYEVGGKPFRVELSDGGVNDNQGVDPLLDQGCDHLIVSDAAAQMADVAGPAVRIPAVAKRVGSIARRASRLQRLLRAHAELDGGPVPVRLMHLQTGLPVTSVPVTAAGVAGVTTPDPQHETGIDPRAQAAIAAMRTDLDAFSDIEAASAMCLGYRATGAVYGELKPPTGWWFGAVDDKLQRPDPALLRRLRISSALFLKPVLLVARWLGAHLGRLPFAHTLLRLASLALGLAALAGLVYGGWALADSEVPAPVLYGVAVASVLGVVMYLVPNLPGLRSASRLLFDMLIPLLLALSGLLSLASVAMLASGALHRAWGRMEWGIGGWLIRAFIQLFTRMLPALVLAAGVVAAGVGGIIWLLRTLIGTPVSLGEFVVGSSAGTMGLVGVLAALAAAAILTLAGRAADRNRAFAVGVGVVLSLVALIGALLAATRIEAWFGDRGGLPPSLTAAYVTLIAAALIGALIVSACMAFALRRIARARNVEGTILPIGMALVVGLLLALTVLLREDVPKADQPTVATPGRVNAVDGELVDLARAHRPLLRFDSGDTRRPLNVAALLAEQPAPQLCDPGCDGPATPDRLAGASAASALHIDPKEVPPSGPRRMYYNVTRHGGSIYLDYWVFYRFNDSPVLPALMCVGGLTIADATCFDHEGDWEGVTAVVADTPEHELQAVIYATHNDLARFSRAVLARSGALDGGRPVVYVARGSHASYPQACAGGCEQLTGGLPEGPYDGQYLWACTAKCVTVFPTDPADAWVTFKGVWGLASCTVGLKLCTRAKGPPSPPYQKRFKTPWRARDCDKLLPPPGHRKGACGPEPRA